MNNDTLKTLYFLIYKTNLDKREVYEAAKKFIDAYEHEGHEQRHKAQEKPPKREWSPETAYEPELKQPQFCPNSKQSNETERALPAVGEWYRDVFGNRYMVLAVLSKKISNEKPLLVLMDIKAQAVYTFPIEDFLNPTFTKE